MAETEEPSTIPNPGRKRKQLSIILVALVIILTGCNLTTRQLMHRHDLAQDRDPDTGIIVGAEPRTIGPEDADTAILFVHGFVGSGNNFWEVPDRLAAEGYRVRVMLNKGHGTTPQDFNDTPKEDLLNHVLDEIHALQKDHQKIILAGHSMGGALITLAAAQESVDGLILGAPYFGVTYHWYYILPVEYWNRITSPLVHRVYKADPFVRVKRPEAKDQIFSYRWIPSGGSKTLMYLGKQANDPDILSTITAPVLLLHGVDDFAASPKAAQDAVAHMSSERKKTVLLQNSDHHIFWDYDREEVSEAILAFVDEISVTP